MTSANKEKPALVAAMNELVALACTARPDWTADQVTAALVDAKTCGMTWAQALIGVARLIVDPDAAPNELVPPGARTRTAVGSAAPSRHADALAEVRIDCANAVAKFKADENERLP